MNTTIPILPNGFKRLKPCEIPRKGDLAWFMGDKSLSLVFDVGAEYKSDTVFFRHPDRLATLDDIMMFYKKHC